MKLTGLLPLSATFLSLLVGAEVDAQLNYAGENRIVYVRHHINVTNLADQKESTSIKKELAKWIP